MTLTEPTSANCVPRLVKSILAIAVGMTVRLDPLRPDIRCPRSSHQSGHRRAGPASQTVRVIVLGVGEAFTLKLKISAVVGLLIASPVWLYQLWRFVTPAYTSMSGAPPTYSWR